MVSSDTSRKWELSSSFTSKRCLRMIHNDKVSNFEELLNKDNSVSIHHNNMEALAIECTKLLMTRHLTQ